MARGSLDGTDVRSVIQTRRKMEQCLPPFDNNVEAIWPELQKRLPGVTLFKRGLESRTF